MPFLLGFMKKIKLLFISTLCLIAIFIGAWVVQDNNVEFGIVLLGFPLWQLPVGLWLLIFFFSGFVAAQCVIYPMIFSLKRQNRRNDKLVRKLDKELIDMQQQSAPEFGNL